MKVTAVVVTYNRIKLLEECVAALLNQDYENMDILLVDNYSTDGTREYMQEILQKHKNKIHTLFLEENIGGAGGFHEGMKYAMKNNPDWLWLMDDDTIPEKDACTELCKAVQLIDGKIGFLSSNVYGMKNECMNTPRMKISQKGENGYADWNVHLEESLVKVNSATFCSCFVSAEAVRTVGLPIKEYFIWGDDTEYTLRLSKYYGQGWLVGKSKVLHKRENGQSLSIKKEDNPNRINVYYYYTRNYLINLKLYYYGYLGALIKTFHFNLIMLQILFGKSRYKGRKIAVLFKGIFAFWFGRYDKKATAKRMNIINSKLKQ
ncbi:MAG: glycosyltransferase family 2 protein [Lachnospiraceae bacterium]|nr:glycosyltransferase family 2 protein [Lachnospiraceae bacterium]